jgi:hypothetical protein
MNREVHISDLIRAHEANPDFNEEEPHKVHWGKFNLIGRLVLSTTVFQKRWIDPRAPELPLERPAIYNLIFGNPGMLMDESVRLHSFVDCDKVKLTFLFALFVPVDATIANRARTVLAEDLAMVLDIIYFILSHLLFFCLPLFFLLFRSLALSFDGSFRVLVATAKYSSHFFLLCFFRCTTLSGSFFPHTLYPHHLLCPSPRALFLFEQSQIRLSTPARPRE